MMGYDIHSQVIIILGYLDKRRDGDVAAQLMQFHQAFC